VSWITSFHLATGREALLNDLVRRFPNLTVIDVAAVMAQVRSIMDRVTLAVEYVFAFTLVAGLLVMYAGILATRDERLREAALLRALGATRAELATGLLAELAVLGALAGLVGTLGATALGWVLATRVLDLPYTLQPALWLLGPLGGAVGVGLAGWLATRRLLREPPLAALRG
jgi:putative ABC transport system permease protein